MELSKLTIEELKELMDKTKVELKKRELDEIAKAREEVLAIAHKIGVPIAELIGKRPRAALGPVAVRYRNPDDASQKWTGRGRKPKWVNDCIEAGKALDDLLVA